MIGDKDPLDVWDDTDPPVTRLEVLEAFVAHPFTEAQRAEGLRLVYKLDRVRGVPRRRLNRVRHILES